MFKAIVLLFALLLLTACPEKGDFRSFKFENNSDVDIYIYLGAIERKFGGTLFPDTAVSRVRAGIPVRRGSDIRISRFSQEVWDVTDTLCLFIFDAGVFNRYSWEEIKSGYKILKRYDLTLEDFQRLRWSIPFPPTEDMRSIRMYPRWLE